MFVIKGKPPSMCSYVLAGNSGRGGFKGWKMLPVWFHRGTETGKKTPKWFADKDEQLCEVWKDSATEEEENSPQVLFDRVQCCAVFTVAAAFPSPWKRLSFRLRILYRRQRRRPAQVTLWAKERNTHWISRVGTKYLLPLVMSHSSLLCMQHVSIQAHCHLQCKFFALNF